MRLYDYVASANCYKARLLLSLVERPYERVAVDIFAGETLTPDYAALNPLRETPVLVTDSGEVVRESNAILWFLAEGTTYLPDAPLERARVVQWLTFEQERIMGGVGGTRFRRMTGREVGARREALGQEGLDLLERHLDSRDFVVDETPTIADISLFAYTHVAPDAGYRLQPATRAWIGRIEALPGFVDDLLPYPPNARPGAGRSIYN